VSQEVLYRKWRPQRFGDVVGQEPVTTTLRNAVAAGSPAHAYLFAGPRGTGKTTTGRILAKAVNCPTPTAEGEPCDVCPGCESFRTGRALDLIELDAASNRGIDEIRDLREGAGYSPNAARYKVYLIDEVHMLTDAAFNALLKTLEEPPPHVIFVLATTESHRLPATIVSRCQRFDFRRISLDAAVGRLRTIAEGEGITVAEGGLDLIARQSTGSLRDAVNLLDQTVAYHGRDLSIEAVRAGLGLVVDHRTGELARAAIMRDLPAGLAVLEGVRTDGLEMRAFMREVVATLRSALLVLSGGGADLAISEGEASALRTLAASARPTDIVAALRALGSVDFRGDAYDSLPAEIAFASLAVGLDAAAALEVAAPVPAAVGQARAQGVAMPAPVRREPVPSARPGPVPPARSEPVEGRAGPRPPRGAERPQAAPGARAPVEAHAEARVEPPRAPFIVPDTGPVSEELARIRAGWDEIRDAVNAQDKKAGALLNKVSYARAVEGDRVEIGFVSRPLMEIAQGPGVLQKISEAVGQTLGRPVQVVPVLWEELRTAGGGPPSQPRPSHLVDEALKQGAELVAE
jgi:DNA polymerase III subunit gamma/tau